MIPAINKNGLPATYKHGHNASGVETRFKPGNKMTPNWKEWRDTIRGPKHHNWTNGVWNIGKGYIRLVIEPEEGAKHPTALVVFGKWTIARSHLVWNQAHPDDLVQPGDHIHHINRDPSDDRPDNLKKMKAGEHISMHNNHRFGRA